MGMDSYLELFTTIYGWTIANFIYSILLDTGIVFIPLIVTIVAVWMEAHVDGTENGGPQWAVRKMEVELYTALFVMSVCFVPTPFTTLDKAHLTYQPDSTVLNPSPAPVTGANSGTTYDNAFGASAVTSGAGVPVPLWWYTVMGLSSGLNSAVRSSISNGFLGLRQAEEVARLATIEDPALRGEAQLFRNQCFVPAHAMFHSPDTPPSAIAATVTADPLYGKDDTEWIGSRTFQQDLNYYASFRAMQTVAGFAFDATGDDKDAAPGTTGYSMPNCLRWWATDTVGLRAKLMDQGGDRLKMTMDYFWGIAKAADTGLSWTSGGFGLDFVKDNVLKQALWRSHSNFVDTDQVLGGQNTSRWLLPQLLSGIGVAEKGFEASFSYYPVLQFLVMAQPLILMALYIFLPLIVMFSRFSLQFMMYGALAIFTVKFWASMWAIARFMDERLVAAMYGDTTILIREFATNGLDGGAKRAILNALTLGLYIAMPMVWSGMMAWVGFKVGDAVRGALQSAHNSGAQAGTSAMQTTASIGRSIVK